MYAVDRPLLSETRTCEVDEIPALLAAQGYCMARVCSPDEARKIYEKFWQFLSCINPDLHPDDPSTWTQDAWPYNNNGVMGMYGMGQSGFMWEARTLPGVLDAFASAWGTRNLVTSFDGANMMVPSFMYTDSQLIWPHRDQNPACKERICIQGVLNLADNLGDHDGGLVVWPHSHGIDWTELDPEWQQRSFNHYYRPQKGIVDPDDGRVLRAPAGTLFLWDSRLIHCNTLPTSPTASVRAAAYICMLPRSVLSLQQTCQRFYLFENWSTTTHWPTDTTGNQEVPQSQAFVQGLRSYYRSATMPSSLLQKAVALI